jgi:FkbM family methyltransferase
VILEIGANDGEHTAGFAREFAEDVVIHAFEPEPRAIDRFRQKNFSQSVHLYEIALGASDGVAEFFQSGGAESEAHPDGWHYSGSIRRPKNHIEHYPWVTFEHSIEVSVRSLDSWADEVGLKMVDFIWMDVQGAENDVIRGGQRLLANTRFLYTEFSNDELYEGQAKLHQLTEALGGWKMIAKFPNDVLFENPNFLSGRVTK